MRVNRWEFALQDSGHRPRAAAEIEGDSRLRSYRTTNEQFGPSARHEHPRSDDDPKSTEFGPSEDRLERLACDSTPQQLVEMGGRGRGSNDQLSFFRGKDTTSRSELFDNVWIRQP